MPKLGRLAPHPESTHPRVKLANHLTAPAVPAVVDYASKVKTWPMYLNGPDPENAVLLPADPDGIGDCTCAGVGHMIQAWTAYAGTEVTLPAADILKLYETLSGFDPETGENDNGCVEQDVLQYLADTGIDGHKIVAFAQVDISNPTEMKTALDMFGTLYLGINVPESMQEQFAEGQPFTYVPGSPIEGGHCVLIQKWDEQYLYIVTWGSVVPATWEWWEHYGEEAWAIVTQDWIEKNGESPVGLNLQGLLSEFQEITASPAPAPAAPKNFIDEVVQVIEDGFNWIVDRLRSL